MLIVVVVVVVVLLAVWGNCEQPRLQVSRRQVGAGPVAARGVICAECSAGSPVRIREAAACGGLRKNGAVQFAFFTGSVILVLLLLSGPFVPPSLWLAGVATCLEEARGEHRGWRRSCAGGRLVETYECWECGFWVATAVDTEEKYNSSSAGAVFTDGQTQHTRTLLNTTIVLFLYGPHGNQQL